jgi:hypothetical protein
MSVAVRIGSEPERIAIRIRNLHLVGPGRQRALTYDSRTLVANKR